VIELGKLSMLVRPERLRQSPLVMQTPDEFVRSSSEIFRNKLLYPVHLELMSPTEVCVLELRQSRRGDMHHFF
jgi:hypothetical protein